MCLENTNQCISTLGNRFVKITSGFSLWSNPDEVSVMARNTNNLKDKGTYMIGENNNNGNKHHKKLGVECDREPLVSVQGRSTQWRLGNRCPTGRAQFSGQRTLPSSLVCLTNSTEMN